MPSEQIISSGSLTMTFPISQTDVITGMRAAGTGAGVVTAAGGGTTVYLDMPQGSSWALAVMALFAVVLVVKWVLSWITG